MVKTKIALNGKRTVKVPEKKVWKLDLGAGSRCREGFTGVDSYAECKPAILHDLRERPWPFDDESVEEVFSSHFIEHLSGPERIPFFDELYRVMKVDAKATFIAPYWSTKRAIQDPTHAWPPISENTFLYFNKKWREDNLLTHYLGTCDFDFFYNWIPGYSGQEMSTKSQEVQQFWINHYVNAVDDIMVTMTKRAKA